MRIRHAVLILYVLFNIVDIVTTLKARYIFPYFNETNPIFIASGSIYLMLIIKIIIMTYLVWWCLKKYDTKTPLIIRYIIIYFVVLLTCMTIGVSINNANVLQLDPEDIKPISEDIRIEQYNNAIGNLEVIKTKQVPFIFILFIINILQFITWRSFERGIKNELR